METILSSSNMTVLFDLRTSTKKLFVTDSINYVGLGEDINNIRGVIMLTGPQGIVYDNEDYDTPDITPSVLRTNNNNIPLPLDPLQNYEQVLKGNYTVKLTMKNIVSEDTYVVQDTYSFQFNEPTIETNIISGPYSGKLLSTDITDYGDNVFSLSRLHTISYPDEMAVVPDPIISTDAEIEVTPIYTNEWTVNIASTVEYHNPDTLQIIWSGTETFTKCVYGSCISSMYDAINTMFENYRDYATTNIAKAETLRKRLLIINTAYPLLDIAWKAGDVEEADAQANLIQEQIEYSDLGICNGSSSEEVVPCPAYSSGGGGGGEEVFAGSGLTKVVDTINLGGLLTQDASINIGIHTHKLTGASGGVSVSHETSLSEGVKIKASDSLTEGRLYAEVDKVVMELANISTPANTRGYEITSVGLIEKADYSAGYTARSLIAKSYFDSNNDWGSQVVISDSSLNGDGTSGSPLSVAIEFPGFISLSNDYGYIEPEHDFSEINNTPTTLAGYGIIDAYTQTELQTSGQSSVHWDNITSAPSIPSDYVSDTGGEFTGQVTINTSTDNPLVLRQAGTGTGAGTPQGGINKIAFQDGDGDVQGYVGIDASGNLELSTLVSSQSVLSLNNFGVTGNIAVSGTVDGVDIATFKSDYDSHDHTFASLTSKPTTLAGYGITDALSNVADSWDTNLTVKASGVAGDRLLIEDSADSYSKKYILVSNLPTAASSFLGLSDTMGSYAGSGGYVLRVNSGATAIEAHDISGEYISTAAGTITSLTEKSTPVSNDVVLIEDSADSYNQKKVLFSKFSGGSKGLVSETLSGDIIIDQSYLYDLSFRTTQTGASSAVMGLNLDGHIDLKAYNNDDFTGESADIQVNPSSIIMKIIGSTGEKEIQLTLFSMLITDSEDSKGLQYADDYSSNYTDRSIPDKEYVDQRNYFIAKGSVLYTNDGSPVTIITLPSNAVVWNVDFYVVTAFNDSVSNDISVGITGSSTRYINANSNITISDYWDSPSVLNIPDKMSVSTNIIATYNGGNSDSSAGSIEIYVLYSLH